jgi:hypothetical protein
VVCATMEPSPDESRRDGVPTSQQRQRLNLPGTCPWPIRSQAVVVRRARCATSARSSIVMALHPRSALTAGADTDCPNRAALACYAGSTDTGTRIGRYGLGRYGRPHVPSARLGVVDATTSPAGVRTLQSKPRTFMSPGPSVRTMSHGSRPGRTRSSRQRSRRRRQPSDAARCMSQSRQNVSRTRSTLQRGPRRQRQPFRRWSQSTNDAPIQVALDLVA